MQQLKGYMVSRLNQLYVENDRELMLFVETSVISAGADEIVMDSENLVSTLNEQIAKRFSPEIHVIIRDASTQEPADEDSAVIYLSVEPKIAPMYQ
jgi:hypothetical protein